MATETRGTPVLDGLANLFAVPAKFGSKLLSPTLDAVFGPWGGGAVGPAPGERPEDAAQKAALLQTLLGDPSYQMGDLERTMLQAATDSKDVDWANFAAMAAGLDQRKNLLKGMEDTRNQYVGGLQSQADDIQKMISSGDYLSDATYRQAFQAATDAGAKNAARAQAGANRSAAAGGFRDAGFLSSRVGQARDAANIAAGNTYGNIAVDAKNKKSALDNQILSTNKDYGDMRTQVLGDSSWATGAFPGVANYAIGNRLGKIGGNTNILGGLVTGGNTLTGNLLNGMQIAGQSAQNGMGMLLNGKFY